jgi:hypothetical protein
MGRKSFPSPDAYFFPNTLRDFRLTSPFPFRTAATATGSAAKASPTAPAPVANPPSGRAPTAAQRPPETQLLPIFRPTARVAARRGARAGEASGVYVLPRETEVLVY